MSDLRRWLPEPDLDLGRFRFTPGDPPRPLPELTADEVRERAERVALRALDAWRAGADSPPSRRLLARAYRLLARVAPETGVLDLLTGQERHDLGIPV